MNQRNLVQKHSLRMNRAVKFKDRKKDHKRGYRKHKKPSIEGFSYYITLTMPIGTTGGKL